MLEGRDAGNVKHHHSSPPRGDGCGLCKPLVSPALSNVEVLRRAINSAKRE